MDDNYRTSYFQKMKTHEPRFLIWKYSHEIFKETNILIGNGFEQTEELLLNKQEVKVVDFWRCLSSDFETHPKIKYIPIGKYDNCQASKKKLEGLWG